MSRKKTPPSYGEPGGPNIVDTHSYKLSPLGPALKIKLSNMEQKQNCVNWKLKVPAIWWWIKGDFSKLFLHSLG